MLTDAQRAEIVSEAKSWIGTKYHGTSRSKGCGCDCISLIVGIFVNTGHLAEGVLPEHYSTQIGQHAETTEYLDGIRAQMDEIPESEVKPGDVVLYRVGVHDNNPEAGYTHSAVVVSWPDYVVHATERHGVAGSHGIKEPLLRRAARKFFTLKGVS